MTLPHITSVADDEGVTDGRITATPKLAARRARDLAEIHAAVCRWRRQGVVCSTCDQFNSAARRLEASRE